jgi:hypothetical protein
MGFSTTYNAFYSSGHPAPRSPLKNPLGLLKSSNSGQTWEQLGLIGKANFHLLATSYRWGRLLQDFSLLSEDA